MMVTLALIIVIATAAVLAARFLHTRAKGDLVAASVCVVAVFMALALT